WLSSTRGAATGRSGCSDHQSGPARRSSPADTEIATAKNNNRLTPPAWTLQRLLGRDRRIFSLGEHCGSQFVLLYLIRNGFRCVQRTYGMVRREPRRSKLTRTHERILRRHYPGYRA